MNEDLADELAAINSIFHDPQAPECIARDDRDDGDSVYALHPPTSSVSPQLHLRLSFPPDYPNSPPIILDDGIGVSLARDVLRSVWREGEVCLYDLVEGLREVMPGEDPEPNEPNKPYEPKKPVLPPPTAEKAQTPPPVQSIEAPQASAVPEHPWTVTPPFVEKKSVFVARAIEVHSAEEAKEYINDLIAGDKKVAKATHNMIAYRIRKENGVIIQDNDDDGETAAGSRMAHLLQLMDVWNVCVVVSRWYGGIKLGPDRFRLINTAAREALVLGGFVKEGGEGGGKGKKKNKK